MVTHDIYFEIKAAIRKATQRDNYANEIGEGELATELRDLRADLMQAVREIDEIRNHTHQWNEDDYCRTCGMDGRA